MEVDALFEFEVFRKPTVELGRWFDMTQRRQNRTSRGSPYLASITSDIASALRRREETRSACPQEIHKVSIHHQSEGPAPLGVELAREHVVPPEARAEFGV